MLPQAEPTDAPPRETPTTLLECDSERREAAKLVKNPPAECR
jgi:hypothetical protein